jgi:hypothetical protein
VEKETYLGINHDEDDSSNSHFKDLDPREFENVQVTS